MNNNGDIIKAQAEDVIETNQSTQVHIYDETNTNTQVHIYEEEKVNSEEKTFTISFLGDLMMGGDMGKNLKYNYMSAFKSIAPYTSASDYTVVNLATNVIDLKELKTTKSKYIVTKDIENAFSALGVDGINIASDHMLDFGKDIFKDTVNSLQAEYDLIGLKNKIVYVEHDGIKVAIIGVCNEVIGTEDKYTDAGIMMYNLKSIKSMIKEAQNNVNTVVLLTHLGLENTHAVTNVMSWFYRELVDAGADVVLGSHALGLYPVEMYKQRPIIYSMSNLMSDTDYLLGKESGVFTLKLDEKGKVKSLEILPLYVNAKKQTVLYSDYNKKTSNKLLQYLASKLEKNSFNIQADKLVVPIK